MTAPDEGYQHIEHGFEPVFDEHSRVLVLGSFPSVLSRANAFYYGNPQNRFWRVLSEVFSSPVPQSTEEKKKLLLDCGVPPAVEHHDVVRSREVQPGAASLEREYEEWRRVFFLLEAAYHFVALLARHAAVQEERLAAEHLLEEFFEYCSHLRVLREDQRAVARGEHLFGDFCEAHHLAGAVFVIGFVFDV